MILGIADLFGAGVSAVKNRNHDNVFVVFASSINFVNICNLVTICRRNKEELIEAVKLKRIINQDNQKPKRKNANHDNYEQILVDCLTLNDIESKILYSLEYQIVSDDIHNTYDSNTQISKDHWKKEWMKLSEESVGINKLFYEDKEKLYAMIRTRASNKGNNGWLYRIALEASLFVPYFPLNEENDRYKKLKFKSTDYVEKVFCQNQDIVTVNDVKELKKTYNKYYNALEHKQEKTAAGMLGGVLVSAGAAVAAYTFAPVIAVFFAGHLFTGLYGAALTSASLALFGGGALAAGGLGMAGGAFVIAGGGALLGMGVSGGMTAATLVLLSAPTFVQRDQAKLLTTCDRVLIKKLGKINDVEIIKEELENRIEQMNIRLLLLEKTADQDNSGERRDLIKEMKKSRNIIQNSVKQIEKMLD